jgi:ketosteroid isomerase-like protein
MNGKLDTKVKGVIQTSDIALVNTEWSFNGTGPDGKAVTITGKATDVLRQQPDRTWRILIDNPWGTDIQTAYEKN